MTFQLGVSAESSDVSPLANETARTLDTTMPTDSVKMAATDTSAKPRDSYFLGWVAARRTRAGTA